MMCAVALMTSIPNRAGIDPASATGAVLLYLLVYAVMNLGAFAVLASVMRQTGSDSIERFRGLGRSSPVLAGSMLCCLISLIGLPPFAGFGAKVIVLWALAQSGGFGLTLVAIIVANTVLSAFYYFRIVRTMYFDTAEPIKPARDAIGTIVAFGCAAVLVIGFFFFGPLYAMATRNQRMDRIVPVVTADESMTSMGRE
jgi:NADH-quinone oxidoreductase subunit N